MIRSSICGSLPSTRTYIRVNCVLTTSFKPKLVKKLNDQIVNIKLLKYKKNKDMFLVSKVFMDRVSRQ